LKTFGFPERVLSYDKDTVGFPFMISGFPKVADCCKMLTLGYTNMTLSYDIL